MCRNISGLSEMYPRLGALVAGIENNPVVEDYSV
jgi:hypothetical protein